MFLVTLPCDYGRHVCKQFKMGIYTFIIFIFIPLCYEVTFWPNECLWRSTEVISHPGQFSSALTCYLCQQSKHFFLFLYLSDRPIRPVDQKSDQSDVRLSLGDACHSCLTILSVLKQVLCNPQLEWSFWNSIYYVMSSLKQPNILVILIRHYTLIMWFVYTL